MRRSGTNSKRYGCDFHKKQEEAGYFLISLERVTCFNFGQVELVFVHHIRIGSPLATGESKITENHSYKILTKEIGTDHHNPTLGGLAALKVLGGRLVP